MKLYYYSLGDENVLGPVTERQLLDLHIQKKVFTSTFICEQGTERWFPLEHILLMQRDRAKAKITVGISIAAALLIAATSAYFLLPRKKVRPQTIPTVHSRQEKKPPTVNNLLYAERSGEITITGALDSNASTLHVPKQVDGKFVTSIAAKSFRGMTSLRSVTLPEGIRTIGEAAFEDCSSLSDIALPKTLTTLDANAFAGCEQLRQIAIPAQMKAIGNSAFANCVNLTQVQFSDGLKDIGDHAFDTCEKLGTIELPFTLQRIGSHAFARCAGLRKIVFPSGLKHIGGRAFMGCTALNRAQFRGQIPHDISDVFADTASTFMVDGELAAREQEPEETDQVAHTGLIRDERFTTMREDIALPVMVNEKVVEYVNVKKGGTVQVYEFEGDYVVIGKGGAFARIKADRTLLADPQQELPAPQSPSIPTAAASAPESPGNAIKPAGGLLLKPQVHWYMHAGAEFTSLKELLKTISNAATPSASLRIDQQPEFFHGVKLMMPLKEALPSLGLQNELVPSPSPISHSGIPFYFRIFPNRISAGANSAAAFNLIYVITDGADRVIGLQFVQETPTESKIPNTPDFTYNYVNNRKRIVSELAVRVEVVHPRDVIVIDTWLIDEVRKKCREICRWYLPDRIAAFLRHVAESRLAGQPAP